jgi:hypothetical protein
MFPHQLVHRINEGMREPPYETMRAHTVTMMLESEADGFILSAGLWDGFEVKRLQDLPAAER